MYIMTVNTTTINMTAITATTTPVIVPIGKNTERKQVSIEEQKMLFACMVM